MSRCARSLTSPRRCALLVLSLSSSVSLVGACSGSTCLSGVADPEQGGPNTLSSAVHRARQQPIDPGTPLDAAGHSRDRATAAGPAVRRVAGRRMAGLQHPPCAGGRGDDLAAQLHGDRAHEGLQPRRARVLPHQLLPRTRFDGPSGVPRSGDCDALLEESCSRRTLRAVRRPRRRGWCVQTISSGGVSTPSPNHRQKSSVTGKELRRVCADSRPPDRDDACSTTSGIAAGGPAYCRPRLVILTKHWLA